MTRSGTGWCPFATQVEGVTSFQSGASTPGFARVCFVDHAAGGFYSTMLNPAFWNGAGVSVHFAIARDGRIAQIINVFDTAWAQGRMGPVVTWPPYEQMKRETGTANANAWGISTEHEDAESINGQTKFIPGSQWTEAQYAADLRVKQWCRDEVRRVRGADCLRFQLDSLAGHHMFDGVSRAECPGRFWRNEYRQRLCDDLTKEAPPVDEEERRLKGLLFNSIMNHYGIKDKGIHPGHGKTVIELTNLDGSLAHGPGSQPLEIAIRT